MAKALVVLVFLTKILTSHGQEDQAHHDIGYPHPQENPGYSFGYGVADTQTGDIKTVWEAKDGDTVKGHYSVIEPDGSMRSVEYSAGPKTGFTASVNNEDLHVPDVPNVPDVSVSPDAMEEKALREYGRQYDYSDDHNYEPPFSTRERKRKRHPYEALFRDYTFVKKPKYPTDLESSEYTHSINIKHPRDDIGPEAAAESHIGFNFDPDCKHKHKKESNYYPNAPDLDFRRQRYPQVDSYKSEYEKYVGDSSNNMEKLHHMYKHNDQYKPVKQQDEYGDWSPTKNDYHGIPDIPPENLFSDYPPSRPKKKYKPSKNPEPYESEDLDDYILVPKRKNKKPPRYVDPPEYHPESDDEFEDTFDDDRYHKPPRPSQKEVVRKIVKKKKPVINLLDIFDI